MNVIKLDAKWLSTVMKTPINRAQREELLRHYALKDFRVVNSELNAVDLWVDHLDMGGYGEHLAIYMKSPWDGDNTDWVAIPCEDSDLAINLRKSGIVFLKREGKIQATHRDRNVYESLILITGLWFLINREVLKKYKTVVKMGKRRHQIQEMGGKRASSYRQKPIKIADGISYTWEYENPRTFNRHCEAWGVRGHYRHYKNGKVVFIQPYVKGSGRLKNSIYELN